MSSDVSTLLSGLVPIPFIHLHHPHHPTSSIYNERFPPRCIVVKVDTIEHFNPRLFFSGILHRLSAPLHTPDGLGEVSSWDAFARGLKAVWEGREGGVNGKGKGKQRALNGSEETRIVILVTKAERLKNVLGAGWSVMTRISEMTDLPITLILASQAPWDELRPPRGDAVEPVHIYFPPLTREETIDRLLPGSSHPLYPRFLDLLYATVQPIIPPSPPLDLEYLSEILFPIYTQSLSPHAEQILLNRPYPDPDNPPPPLSITVKLLTELKHQSSLAFTSAIENVLPRVTGRHEFSQAFTTGSSNGFINGNTNGVRGLPKAPSLELPLCAKYLVIAAYCASYNPPKSDMRLFGRGVGDGKRRRGGGARRSGYGRTRIGKVPQRLLGPKPFPLDRLLAIFASIFVEHAERPEDLQSPDSQSESGSSSEDDELDLNKIGMNGEKWLPSIEQVANRAKRKRAREVERDERWEEEVEHLTMSVKLWSLIPEIEGQGLLRRISPVERLDNVMLRCEVDYETVRSLARELKITLDEYLYEAVL